jgi:hypothetical protein
VKRRRERLTLVHVAIFAPGVPQLMEEFESDSIELASFVVSVYVLGVSPPRAEIELIKKS